MNTRIAIIGAIAALATGLLATATAQPKAQTAQCGIMEITADNGPGGVDKRLKGLAKKAKKPPLSSWKTLKLVKRWDKQLTKMKSLQLDLVKGGKVDLVYKGHQSRVRGKSRWSMTVQMETKSGKEVANTNYSGPSGDFLVVGYALPDNSGHLVAVQCTVK